MANKGHASIAFRKKDLNILKRFRKPHDIQDCLNSISYDEIPGTSSPRMVMEEGKANCFEGALFAAAALRMIGRTPLIVDMIAQNDDDHVIALFKGGNTTAPSRNQIRQCSGTEILCSGRSEN